MSPELTSLAHPDCVLTINDELSGMARRLRVLISASSPSPESLSEIITIYSNVAYLFVYLEGNERYLNYRPLVQQRDKFFKDAKLSAGILQLMSRLCCLDPESEALRLSWMAWFQEHSRAEGQDINKTLEEFNQSAQQVLHRIQEDQAKMLVRLGVNTETGSTAAIFYRIMSETQKPDTRSKLAEAWNKQRDRRTNELADIVDQMVRLRRQQAKEKGFSSTLEQTFERCSVSESDAYSFITAYLLRALDSFSRLASNISSVTAGVDRPMDHFGYFVRTGLSGSHLPMIALDDCLDFLFTVADCVFKITPTHVEQENPHTVDVALSFEARRLGTVSFDLLDTGHARFSNDGDLQIRARSDSTGMTKAASRVLCRFQIGADGTRLITFESAHSIFHEFGHALNHLLLRKRLPGTSGLNYLPVERLEDLSSWFEKWVFHPDFAPHLSLSCQDKEGLTKCRQVKMLEFQRTNLGRAVTAALDFDVHSRPAGGVRESFEGLDEQFAISDRCSLGEVLEHFATPVFRANPGASFVYLRGAAYGAQNFAPFANLRIGDIPLHKRMDERFSSCFDPDEPSTELCAQAVFDFYNVVL